MKIIIQGISEKQTYLFSFGALVDRAIIQVTIAAIKSIKDGNLFKICYAWPVLRDLEKAFVFEKQKVE